MNNNNQEKEQQVIDNAVKVTKRLEGDEVVIEIRIPAYIYSDRKDWSMDYGRGGQSV